MSLFSSSNNAFSLGVGVMDDTHEEFIGFYEKLLHADDQTFPDIFEQFVEHTTEHFLSEDKLMEESGFPAIKEHRAEHQRVLNELKYFQEKVRNKKYSFARFYIKDKIPDWFRQHLAMMDSALAFHLKQTEDIQLENFS